MKRLGTVLVLFAVAVVMTSAPTSADISYEACGVLYDFYLLDREGQREYNHGANVPAGWYQSLGFADLSWPHGNKMYGRTLEHVEASGKVQYDHHYCG